LKKFARLYKPLLVSKVSLAKSAENMLLANNTHK